jgi:hypothetical protein
VALIKPSERFASEIRPAYSEYLVEPLSERRANAAARAVAHQIEWTFEYYDRSDKSRLPPEQTHAAFRLARFAECPALKVMWELSDAAHHRFLEPHKIKRLIAASTDAYFVVTDELWVKHHNQLFAPALKAAVDFWRCWPD